MLTLDEPDLNSGGGYEAWLDVAADDLLPVEHLFMAVRSWCDDPPFGQIAHDSDPLYRMHGDPRD